MRILNVVQNGADTHGTAIVDINELLGQLKRGRESGNSRHYLCEMVSENISREIFEEGCRQYIELDGFVEVLTQGLKLLEGVEQRPLVLGFGVFDQLTLKDISTLVGYDVYEHRDLGFLTCEAMGYNSKVQHYEWLSNNLQFQLRVGLLERLLSMGVSELKIGFHFQEN